MVTETTELQKIDDYTKKEMDYAKSIMHDDYEASYYVPDDFINKLDQMVTAYGKKTGSSFLNHKNFVLVRISNGIVNMRNLKKKLQNKLNEDKKSGNVDDAIKETHFLDTVNKFDFESTYGADNMPATNFYSDSMDHGEIPQLNTEDVIKDILYSDDEYTVGPDIIYMFLRDFRKNLLNK